METIERAIREREANAFLDAIFGRKPSDKSLFIQIWAKSSKSSSYVLDVPTAATRALAVDRDAYVGVSLVGKDLGRKRRGGNDDAIGIGGFWADIDVNGGPEGKRNAAPDFEAAYALANAVLAPTIIVHSGYGLQSWWLFEEPWIFGSAAERARASQLSAGWIARLRREAREQGFTIDATQDLARLMRVPGTTNAKGSLNAPVTGYGEPIFEQDGPRYEVEVIAEHAERVEAKSNGIVGGEVSVDVHPEATPPFAKLEALRENNPKFELTWKRERRDLVDKSPSGYCLSIASFCAHAGFSDQEIANTLIAYRAKHGDDEKYDEWYGRTIRKARSTIREQQRDDEREDAVEKLVEIGENDEDDADPDRIATLFSEMIGGGYHVKELVQSNDDPDAAIFRLILSNGTVVKIGHFDNLDDPNKFAKRFAVVTGYRPKLAKKGDWIKALNGLLKMRTIRDAEVTTLRSQVLSALRSYVDATLTPDHNEAAARRDPFERGHFIWIAPKSFHDYMTRQLRKRITFGDLEEVLDTLGFEKRAKNYRDPDTPSGQNTTRDYYRAPRALLDEAEHEEGDDE